MIKKNLLRQAGSTVEYMALIVFLLGALFIFRTYIQRAFWGQWKKAGDVFGHGKQYDPRSFSKEGKGGGTLECMFVFHDVNYKIVKDNPDNHNGSWVTQPKYDECMLKPGSTVEGCVTAHKNENECATNFN